MSPAHETLGVVRCDDIAPQPWRNGGGRTRELLTWPLAGDWLCRISVADIERGGPFSSYPGIDRWLVVVEGAGVLLRLPEGVSTRLSSSPPLAFPGEAAPDCRLLAGPTRDLNLMSLRGRGRASMWRALPDTPWTGPATVRACFSADPVTLHRDTADPRLIEPFTLAWSAESTETSWRMQSTVAEPRAWWMSFAIGDDA